MTIEGIDVTKSGDRGVLKKIIKEGEGTETPCNGCTVSVHYTGTLVDGTKFDSSRDRNSQFSFTLGKDSVIKAWELGLLTMKKGEICQLTCAPQYAYGEAGNRPTIPPNATLIFEVELISWELEDLSPTKTKGIQRRIVEPGQGPETPVDNSVVTVDLEGRLVDDGRVFETRTVTFTMGEGECENICAGVEIALKKFYRNEKSILTIQPKYAFKAKGNEALGVPANATVEYTVTLTSFETMKELYLMDGQEKIEQALLYKERGTNYYKEAKYSLAIKMYKKSVNFVSGFDEDRQETEEDKAKAKEILLTTYLNLSMVYLKTTPVLHFEANGAATKALELDPDNVKGLYRRGQALLGLGEAQQAIKDFQRIIEIEPENKAAANQLIVCRNTVAKLMEKEKRMYANMFDKFAKHDTEVTETVGEDSSKE